jgi:hypothetical protein
MVSGGRTSLERLSGQVLSDWLDDPAAVRETGESALTAHLESAGSP